MAISTVRSVRWGFGLRGTSGGARRGEVSASKKRALSDSKRGLRTLGGSERSRSNQLDFSNSREASDMSGLHGSSDHGGAGRCPIQRSLRVSASWAARPPQKEASASRRGEHTPTRRGVSASRNEGGPRGRGFGPEDDGTLEPTRLRSRWRIERVSALERTRRGFGPGREECLCSVLLSFRLRSVPRREG